MGEEFIDTEVLSDRSNKCKHCGHVAALRRTMPPHYAVTQEGESGFELQVGFTVSTGV